MAESYALRLLRQMQTTVSVSSSTDPSKRPDYKSIIEGKLKRQIMKT